MRGWTTYRLGEICSRIRSGKGISASKVSSTGKYPVIGGNGIRGYTDSSNFNGSCAVVGRQGAYCGNVRFFDGEAYMTEHAVVIVGNELADTRYLAYLLSIMRLGHLSAQSAQPGLSVQTLSKLPICVPDLPTQRRIAGILGLLDDKIELNRRINANLEAQAQALFINISRTCPTQKGILKDLIEIKYGKDHKKLNVGNIPVYGSGGIMRYVDTSIYEKETVLIPRKGSLNNVIYLNTPFWSVDTMFYSVMKYDHIAKYVYFFLKSKDLSAMNAGSAVPSMTTDILYQMEINIPDKTVFETYDTIVSPLFKQIQVNQEENQSLSALRNTLLPKLLSGEILINKSYEKRG